MLLTCAASISNGIKLYDVHCYFYNFTLIKLHHSQLDAFGYMSSNIQMNE